MTVGDCTLGASQNLLQTYLRLGLATPGAIWEREEGFDLCLGDLDHPICNFAAGLNLDPWSARRLVTIAESRPSFNVYASPGDGPEYLDELLVRAGFCHAYRLVQLVAEPPEEDSFETMDECTVGDRDAISRFMVDQFFSQRPISFRTAIAEATARATGVELYFVRDRSRIVAALMLSQAGGMLGVYNLCVAPASRGRGIGSSVVRWALGEARRRGMMATMQCEPHLETWYGSLGFQRSGWLNVYRLSKGPTSDIIDMV